MLYAVEKKPSFEFRIDFRGTVVVRREIMRREVVMKRGERKERSFKR